MSTYSTEGLILRRSNFGEANLLLHIYTKNFGKIEAVARSAKKSQGKLKGHLEPFLCCDFLFAHGRKIDTITNSFITENYLNLRNDMAKTFFASAFLEIIDKMTIEGYRDERFFVLLKKLLEFLDRDESRDLTLYAILILFLEINLLTLSGFRPHMDQCVFCGEKILPGKNKFSFSMGGALHDHCGVKCPDAIFISDDSIRLIRFIEIKNFDSGDYAAKLDRKLSEIKRLKVERGLVFQNIFSMRDFISFSLDKKINSLEIVYDFALKEN